MSNTSSRKGPLFALGLLVLLFGVSVTGVAKSVYSGNYKKGEIQILKEELIFGNKWIQFYNDKVKFPNGKEGTYFRVVPTRLSPQGLSGAAVLAFTKDDKIILEEIFRHAPRKWLLEAPRGGWEPGELLLQTAKRELSEETGFSCSEWKDLGALMPDSGALGASAKLFLAQQCTKKTEGTDPEETKRIQLKFFSWDEIIKMVEKDKIQDSFTLALILKAQKFRITSTKNNPTADK